MYEKSEDRLEIETMRVFSDETVMLGENTFRVKVTVSFTGVDKVYTKNLSDMLLVEVNRNYDAVFRAVRNKLEKEAKESEENAQ